MLVETVCAIRAAIEQAVRRQSFEAGMRHQYQPGPTVSRMPDKFSGQFLGQKGMCQTCRF